jgi:sec-independent protein translocase protein TatA
MPLIAMPGITELLIIFGVIFLLFGAKKLPGLGGAIGESIKNFKKGIKDSGEPDAKELTPGADSPTAPKADETK